MDNWPICTEWPEEAWNTSSWYAPQVVTRKLNQMTKDGKKLPNVDVVTEVTNEIKQMIFNNNGISAHRPLDFNPVLERLEHV